MRALLCVAVCCLAFGGEGGAASKSVVLASKVVLEVGKDVCSDWLQRAGQPRRQAAPAVHAFVPNVCARHVGEDHVKCVTNYRASRQRAACTRTSVAAQPRGSRFCRPRTGCGRGAAVVAVLSLHAGHRADGDGDQGGEGGTGAPGGCGGEREGKGEGAASEERQRETPYLTALSRTAGMVRAPFFFPGHQQGRLTPAPCVSLSLAGAYALDLPEDVEELDTLSYGAAHAPLSRAQALAAELFGARHSFFLCNGSTGGIIAALLAAVQAHRCSSRRRAEMRAHERRPHATEVSNHDHQPVVILPRNAHKSAVQVRPAPHPPHPPRGEPLPPKHEPLMRSPRRPKLNAFCPTPKP
jgi:hypothetical protein